MNGKTPIRVVIVEDDTGYLEGLSLLFADSPSIEVVGSYTAGKDAIKGIIQKSPDVALIDIGLPDISGIDVIKEVSKNGCSTELLVLTVRNDDEHLFSALRAGAVGYIVKNEILSLSEVLRKIDEAVKGGAPMFMEIARRILDEFRDSSKKMKRPELKALTNREIEILEYFSKGYNTRKVAEALDIEYETVRTHLKNIYKKLHVNSLIEAVAVFKG